MQIVKQGGHSLVVFVPNFSSTDSGTDQRKAAAGVTTDYGSCVDDSRGGVSHGEGTEVFRRFNPLSISVSVCLDLYLLVASNIFLQSIIRFPEGIRGVKMGVPVRVHGSLGTYCILFHAFVSSVMLLTRFWTRCLAHEP